MNNQAPIRVLVVDDYPVICRGLAAILTTYENLLVVGEADDGEAAIRLCATTHPDVIVMDLHMPHMDGLAATRHLRRHYPEVQILILTGDQDDQLVQDALKAGANGYLLKHGRSDEIVSAIRAAGYGQPAFAPEAMRALLSAIRQDHASALGHDLSEREREVLTLLAKGFDNQCIAERLVITQATAKFHVSKILAKLHAQNRTHAVTLAVEHKIIARERPVSLDAGAEVGARKDTRRR
jgi:NarL family two-component system response regulator LiaR